MKKFAFMALLLGLTPAVMVAQDSDDAWKKEMEKKIDALTRQLEKKPSASSSLIPNIYEGERGFAPAASKVYHVNQGVSIGGYGEMVYNNYESNRDDGAPSGSKDQIDFLRNIVYVGYKFTDKIIFNSEIEFEHASTSNGGSRGEVSLEFANIDFQFRPEIGARAGLLLVPVGLRNELHEPTLFHGVSRPSTESRIIPTTWRSNGAGVFGQVGPIEYRSYVVASLQGINDTGDGFGGFSSNGLRGGRTKGAKSRAEDMAWVGRVDYSPFEGTMIGGSYYAGDTGQDTADANGNEIEGTLNLWEVHAIAEYRGFEIDALYAKATLDDVTALNAAQSTPLTGNGSIGEEMFGGYVTLAYNVLSLFDTRHYLAPFVRYERYDTQQEVPSGFSKNPARDRKEITVGVSYKPISQVVIKLDVQNADNDAGTGVDSVNAGLGYMF